MSNPKISVIILNWNGWQDTLECLDSMSKIDYPNCETVIVDNDSKNESVEKIKEWLNANSGKTRVNYKLIVNDHNAGFAGGNNKGIDYAVKNGADYVFLLNNDTLADPSSIGKLAEAAEADKTIGIAGSKIYYYPRGEKERIWFAGGKVNWLKTKGEHIDLNKEEDGGEKKNENSEQRSFPVDYITGCAMLIRREVIEKIGMLSDDYFLYYEDTDYCLRARRAGWQCVLVPESHIWHKISRSTKELSSSYIYYHARNGLLMAKRTSSAAMIPIVYLFSAYLAAKQAVKYIIQPRKREWAKMILLGIYDFYIGKAGKISL